MTAQQEQLIQFIKDHPELRPWQAIYSWSGAKQIEVDGKDPFYWEGGSD
jgi:hypothetical protein